MARATSSSISGPSIAGRLLHEHVLAGGEARRASSKWVGTGVATTTASRASSASISSKLAVQRACG